MKRRILAAAAAIAATFGVTAAAQQPAQKVRINLASAFPTSLTLIGEAPVRLSKKIERASGGTIDLKVNEPGALVPALQAIQATRFVPLDRHGFRIQAPCSSFHQLFCREQKQTPPSVMNWIHRISSRTIKRLLAVIGLFSFLASAAFAGPARPNILFILSDDLRPDLSCYGSYVETPNLDRLAGRGVRFANAWVQYPLCNPSRTSMLTGRHPTTRGALSNRNYFRDTYPDMITLPQLFKNAGYDTLRMGKVYHDRQLPCLRLVVVPVTLTTDRVHLQGTCTP